MSKAGITSAWYLLVNVHEFTSLSLLIDKKAVGIILLVCLNFHDLDFASRQAL